VISKGERQGLSDAWHQANWLSRIGSLELFLHQEIGVDEDAALAYLSDGRRITSANIRDLASVQDHVRLAYCLKRLIFADLSQFIFVFNKYYLDYDVDVVLRQLQVEPRLQPTIEGRCPTEISISPNIALTKATDAAATTPPIRHAQIAASYARTAQLHHEHVQHLLQSISLQHKALQIASNNLDFHVLAISETFDNIAVNGRKELEKQASLLDGLDADLELISRVSVHVEFCSAAVRMAIEAGEPHRVLADYVSKPKMKQVADTCAKTHGESSVVVLPRLSKLMHHPASPL
jgi:autophagy-related protein 11